MQKKKLWIVLTSVALVAGAGTGIIYSQQAKAQEESRIEAQKEQQAADLLQKQTAEKETNAKNTVAALYFDDKKVLLADDFTPAKATAAKQLADALDNKDLKGALVGDIAKANVLYASMEGTQKATQALFKDANQKALAAGVDTAKLTAVKKAIDSVPQNLAKSNLNKGWIIASNLLKADIAAKQKAEVDRVAKEQAAVATKEQVKEVPESAGESSTSQGNNSRTSSSADSSTNSASASQPSSNSKSNNSASSKNYSSNEQTQQSDSNNGGTTKKMQPKSKTESQPNPNSGSGKNSSSAVSDAPKKEEQSNNYSTDGKVNKVEKNINGGEDIYFGW